MQIHEAKIGDQIKVPLDGKNFTFNAAGLSNENHLIVTVVQHNCGTSVIGWVSDHCKNVYPQWNASTRPELFKKFPKLKYGVDITNFVPCELIPPKVKTKRKSKSVGLLLACVGAGAAVSRLTQNRSARALTSLTKKIAK